MEIKWKCPITPNNNCFGEECFAFRISYEVTADVKSFYDTVKIKRGFLGRITGKEIHIVKTQNQKKIRCTYLGNDHIFGKIIVEDADYWRSLIPSFNEKKGTHGYRPFSEFTTNHEEENENG